MSQTKQPRHKLPLPTMKKHASLVCYARYEGFNVIDVLWLRYILVDVYVVYKAKNIYHTWIEHGPPGARYNCTSHGWFDGITFKDWFRTIFVPRVRLHGPKVLMGDNLASNFFEELIALAEKDNIRFVCLPANRTHLTQPLYVAYFRLVKIIWRNILNK